MESLLLAYADVEALSASNSCRFAATEVDLCPEVLVSEPGMSMPYGVAVDGEANQVYWTDRKAGRIQRLTLVCHSGVKDGVQGCEKCRGVSSCSNSCILYDSCDSCVVKKHDLMQQLSFFYLWSHHLLQPAGPRIFSF